MEELSSSGHRFRRVQRHSVGRTPELDPIQTENLEQLPHLNELVHCYKADWVKDDHKYGHYESIAPISFQNQVFEGPDTDIETEMRLSSARYSANEDVTDDDIPSTSGRQSAEAFSSEAAYTKVLKHFGESPLPAYEPAFDWENERSMIFGQRMPESKSHYGSGLKISVKVLSLSFQAGLVEPFYGTICLYNRERREKLSEDFYFHILPTEMQDDRVSSEHCGIFSLDAPSTAVCLLIQLEKPATEEGGVTPSVYSRKDPVHLTEREKQKLNVWSRIMPYRESFSWAIVPLFDNNAAAASGGAASPSSPLAPGITGSSSLESVAEPATKITLDGKLAKRSNGNSFIVEISNLNKVKESYTEDSLQDPKRKVHKPVKGVLRLEIEKIQVSQVEFDNVSETGSVTIDSLDVGDRFVDSAVTKSLNNSGEGTLSGDSRNRNGSNVLGNNPDFGADDFQALDFRTMTRSEPFTQLIHCLYVYPLTVSLSRKRNLFIRVELRKDDADPRKQPLEAIYPRDTGAPLQKFSHTQVAAGSRVAYYHDEIKLCLPAILTPQQHILFTFFHVDLQTKLEAPKPVVIGYAALPLTMHAQYVIFLWPI